MGINTLSTSALALFCAIVTSLLTAVLRTDFQDDFFYVTCQEEKEN